MTYKVEETDAGGLNSKLTGETGTISATKKASSTCTNTRPNTPPPSTPKTGDIYNPALTGLIAGGGLMLLVLAFLRRKRERKA